MELARRKVKVSCFPILFCRFLPSLCEHSGRNESTPPLPSFPVSAGPNPHFHPLHQTRTFQVSYTVLLKLTTTLSSLFVSFYQLLSSYRALSPTLPPSPPPSRSPSPRPSHHLPPSASTSSSSSSQPLASTSTASTSSTNKRSIPSPPSEEDDVKPFAESRKRVKVEEEAKDAAEAERALRIEKETKELAIAERKRKRASEVWDTDRFKRLGKV